MCHIEELHKKKPKKPHHQTHRNKRVIYPPTPQITNLASLNPFTPKNPNLSHI